MKTNPLVGVFVALTIASAARAHAQDTPVADIRITRAIYGAAEGSADVTPVVTALAQPGLDDFYAAPKWLEVDPAVGTTKNLVIFYEYRGEPHVLTTREDNAISHTILVEHADPATRRRPVPNDSGIVLIHAWYGQSRQFQDVTTLAGALIRRGAGAVDITDAALLPRATAGNKVLMLNYSFNGVRNTWTGWVGTRISYDALVLHAQSGGQSRTESDAPPAWLQDAHPKTAVAPRGADPGDAPHRESGVSALLEATAELEAIPASSRSAAATAALTATTKALAIARGSLGHPFPPPGTPPQKARGTSTDGRLANAVQALTTALEQFSAANPGRGDPAIVDMIVARADVTEALVALGAPPSPSPGRGRAGRGAARAGANPDAAAPGSGRAPRREMAISELLAAVAELEAVPANGRSAAITAALDATRKATADAQVEIGYPYPLSDSPPPKAAGTSTAAHVSNAVKWLTTALDNLGAASPSRGADAAAAKTRALAEMNEALAALR